jgi:hypothetical protein
MSKTSAKSGQRSAKTARRAVKKGAKSANGGVKKASKSARRTVGVSALRSIAVRAPSVAPQHAAAMIRTASPPVQPSAMNEIPSRHKYRVGEMVYYTSPTFGRASASGNYTVVKLLPSEGDDCQYRIKSSGEAFERVAKESQLDRL